MAVDADVSGLVTVPQLVGENVKVVSLSKMPVEPKSSSTFTDDNVPALPVGLVNVSVNTDVPPVKMVVGLKDLETVGGAYTITEFVEVLLLVLLSAKTKSGLTTAVLLNIPVEEDVTPTSTVMVAPTGMVTPPLATHESN